MPAMRLRARRLASEETQRKWHEGFLTARQAHARGAVSLIRVEDNSLVWAQEVSDKNRWWGSAASEGHRKVAKRVVDELKGIHQAQLLTYMKLAGIKTGLLMNFNVTKLKNGIKRYVL